MVLRHLLTQKQQSVSWFLCMALEISFDLPKSTGVWTFTWMLCVWFRLSWRIPDLASNLPLEVMALS